VVDKVLIIGGGIGGFSTAIALKQRGVPVEIVELQQEWKVYHVGIIVQSNFVRALAQIGVGREAVDAGFPYKGWRWLDNNGSELGRSEGVSTAGPEYPSDLGLARPALHRVLLKRVQELGITLRRGITFTEILQTDTSESVSVAFTDGTRSSYDLVVGADGAYSRVRDVLFEGRFVPSFTGQGVWRYNLPRPPGLEFAEAYIGDPSRSIGTVPLTNDTMYLFIAVAEPGNPRFPPHTLAAEMRQRLQGYGPTLAQLASQIVDPALVVYRPLEVCVLPSPWYKGRVVLIGDAAHSMTPHLGQGAAMAVEDAIVLADEYSREGPIEKRLQSFMSRRYARAKFVADSSRQLGEWQLNPSPRANPMGLYHNVRQFIGQPI
jgi:2-polyprenyl-6-methoxyphenol hydroxylase-like FAD-dependent oxidoreductase